MRKSLIAGLATLLFPWPARAAEWFMLSASGGIMVGVALASGWLVLRRRTEITEKPLKILLFAAVFWPVIFAQSALLALIYWLLD